MILIVSNTQDITCDFVVRELRRRDRDFARLNLDEFPQYALAAVTAGNRPQEERAELRWTNRDRVLHFGDVGAVLYRRPVPPVPDAAVQDDAIRKFCIDECYDFLRGVLLSLDCHWISHPESIRKAEHKLYQMKIAGSVGLLMPRTLVTNDPIEVSRFYDACSGRMIVKCVHMGFVDDKSNPRIIYTSVVEKADLEDVSSVRFAPSIFQECLDKDFDLRVTVVGERVFAAKIEADLLPNVPDWRSCDFKELRHSGYTLPSSVEQACRDLVRQLGLDFGAIDFGVDRQGTLYFLEINPNGQWAWLESILELPISAALVDRLEEMDR